MPILVRVELGEPESADAVAPVVQLVASGTASRYRCVPLRVRPPFRNAYERWCDVEIAVGLDRSLGLSWDQYRELGRHAARLGYQSVWTNASIDRDAMQICAQWSVASADVAPGGIGTGVSVVPVGYWSVPALASSAATVGEISGGKFVLGVGSGSLHLPAFRRSLGLDKNLRPLATMRVAGNTAGPAGRRNRDARGRGHHAARHHSWVQATEGARGAGCPWPEHAAAGR